MWTSLFPLAYQIFELYVKNSSSKKDDLVLKVIQEGADYLANKSNNTVDKKDCNILKQKKVFK